MKKCLLAIGILLFLFTVPASAAPTLVSGSQINRTWNTVSNLGLKLLGLSTDTGLSDSGTLIVGGNATFETLQSCTNVQTNAAGRVSCNTTAYISALATLSGTGASTQIPYFTSTHVLSGATLITIDETNHRVGIGKKSPLVALDVAGTLSGSALNIQGGNSYILGNTSIGKSSAGLAKLDVVGTISGSLITQNGAGSNYLMGKVGIGTTTPKAKLTVVGSGAFTGTLSGSALNIQGGNTSILGNTSIGKTGAGLAKLDVVGTISGSTLKITGATTLSSGALITPSEPGGVGLTVNGVASQTADLLDLTNSDGTIVWAFTPGGGMTSNVLNAHVSISGQSTTDLQYNGWQDILYNAGILMASDTGYGFSVSSIHKAVISVPAGIGTNKGYLLLDTADGTSSGAGLQLFDVGHAIAFGGASGSPDTFLYRKSIRVLASDSSVSVLSGSLAVGKVPLDSRKFEVVGTISGSALNIQGGSSYILGNTAIGSSNTAKTKLEVAGTISGTALKIAGVGQELSVYKPGGGTTDVVAQMVGSTSAGNFTDAFGNTGSRATLFVNTQFPGTNGPIANFAQAGASRFFLEASGNVGIGQTSPKYLLDVNGAANARTLRILKAGNGTTEVTSEISGSTSAGSFTDGFGNTGSRATLYIDSQYTGANGALVNFTQAGTSRFYMQADGNTGMGTVAPHARLDVVGTISGSTLTVSGTPAELSSQNSLCITAAGVVQENASTTCLVSSLRFKHDVLTMKDLGLQEINALRPVYYKDNSTNTPEMGLIAEEVQKIDPTLVFYDKDGKTVRGVKYENTVALLVKGLQEEDKKVAVLQREVNQLKSLLPSKK